MMLRRIVLSLCLLFAAAGAHASCPPVPFGFVPGQLIQSAQMNANLAALVGCINAIPAPSTGGALNPVSFGLLPATSSFFNVTTVAGNTGVTIGGATFTRANVGDFIRIAGAGPNELWYIGQIAAVTGTNTLTVTPAPTQSMSAFSTIVYYGPDGSGAINAACTAAKTAAVGVHIPSGIYMVANPIQCNVFNYNNQNIPPPMISADSGAALVAVSNMAGSVPVAGTLLTVGGYANGSDFSQFIRNSFIDGSGLTLDCSFLCNYAFGLPFSKEVRFQNLEAKNTVTAGFHLGDPNSPNGATAAVLGDHNKVERDVFYVPISNITSANPPIVTTTIDHGITTGRIVSIIGANNLPNPGRIQFIATSTGARTLALHNINGAGWVPFSGTANLALSYPTNAYIHPIFNVSTANPTQIQIDGDLNLANNQTWCIYGVGGTGANGTTSAPTNVPDGCYTVSNVSGAGADGPFNFTVPVNTAGLTFTGGGIAFERNSIADMGFYLDNASDVQLSDNIILGTRWPIYANPVNSGFNGKFSHNHSANYIEQGWMTAGHVLGGSNSLIGEQVDTPSVFGSIFSAGANSSTGSGYNGSFPFVVDAASWLFRLDAGTDVAGALSATGSNVNGESVSIRSSTLSNHFFAGNPTYFGTMVNYLQYGFGNAGGMLYPLPDTTQVKPAFTGTANGVADTTSLTYVAGGLAIGNGCAITPRYGGQVTLEITGTISNNTVGFGGFVQVFYGTGAPPAAGAAFGGGVGTAGNQTGLSAEPLGTMAVPFKAGGVVNPTLAVNVPAWFDIGFRATGHTAEIANLTCTAVEN